MAPASLTMHPEPSPGAMWADFSHAWGPSVMSDCYGAEELPLEARHGETVYSFWPVGVTCPLAGWSSVAEYPKEPGHFELALGVWPEYQRRGHRTEILELTAGHAFATLNASLLTMLVFDSNVRHAAQCLREANAGSPWTYSGRVWYPDALRMFTLTRDAWESGGRRA